MLLAAAALFFIMLIILANIFLCKSFPSTSCSEDERGKKFQKLFSSSLNVATTTIVPWKFHNNRSLAKKRKRDEKFLKIHPFPRSPFINVAFKFFPFFSFAKKCQWKRLLLSVFLNVSHSVMINHIFPSPSHLLTPSLASRFAEKRKENKARSNESIQLVFHEQFYPQFFTPRECALMCV
jgi:hypothetical protein